MHLFLTFSAALGNMSKLYCTRLHENWRRLGIIQVNLASALALHKRCYIRSLSCFSLRFSAALGIVRTSSALHSLARKFPFLLVYLFTKYVCIWQSYRFNLDLLRGNAHYLRIWAKNGGICTLKKHAGPGISAIRLRAAGYAVLFLCGGIYNIIYMRARIYFILLRYFWPSSCL